MARFRRAVLHMNTFERHRLHLLRRQRMRLLRRRALLAAASFAAILAAWHILARLGPDAIAPVSPAEVGVRAASGLARTAAVSINGVHAGIRPGFREEAKREVLRLLARAPSTDTPSVDAASAEASGGVPDPVPTASHLAPFTPSAIDSPDATAESAAMLADLPATSAKTLDILLIGIDSRLGSDRGRADALHLLTVDFAAPLLRITSIPRGTHSSLGYKNEASNIIANVRAARGRGELQRRVARLCQRDSVPYFVEVGFSDAFGILELLGYDNPGAELQALRQRKGYQFGDHNRCYNQGMFIRTAILRMLPLLEGATGDLLLRAGLDLVHTNLSAEQCRGIVYLLNDAGLTAAPSLVEVTLRSPFRKRIERGAPDISASHAVAGLAYEGKSGDALRAEKRIRKALADAETARDDPRRVQRQLWTMFTQHAWLQLEAGKNRRLLRDSLAACLIDACQRLHDGGGIATIRRTLRADDLLFRGEQKASGPPAVSRR